MKAVIMDKTSCAVVALYDVTSITWADNVTTIVGKSYSSSPTAQTFTANSDRYIVRIIEN